ncbi:hypothetical protein BGZ60DRAFT_549280 [Tricladium varicosporioides]|nr:hypothetical protein BGZ60DRAFT_549280 [Hymenoscyphus varicosporioides]
MREKAKSVEPCLPPSLRAVQQRPSRIQPVKYAICAAILVLHIRVIMLEKVESAYHVLILVANVLILVVFCLIIIVLFLLLCTLGWFLTPLFLMMIQSYHDEKKRNMRQRAAVQEIEEEHTMMEVRQRAIEMRTNSRDLRAPVELRRIEPNRAWPSWSARMGRDLTPTLQHAS